MEKIFLFFGNSLAQSKNIFNYYEKSNVQNFSALMIDKLGNGHWAMKPVLLEELFPGAWFLSENSINCEGGDLVKRKFYENIIKAAIYEYPDDCFRMINTLEKHDLRKKKSENILRYYIDTRMKGKPLPVLSESQILSLEKTWGELFSKGIIRPEWYQMYLSKLGVFNPNFIGTDLHYYYTEWKKIDYDYLRGFLDKNYIDILLRKAKQPRVICRKIYGIYLDHDFNKITLDKAVELIEQYKEKNGAVIKISRISSGGKGLKFIDKDTDNQEICRYLSSGNNFVVQEIIRQHPEMAKMNRSSVNTVRVLSVMINGESVPLSSVVRIGKAGSRVDNFSSGGVSCGINDDGSLKEYAYNNSGDCFKVHSNGFVFKTGKVPNYNNILELTKILHYCVPMFGVISWDIAIDEFGEPILIEYNVSQGQIDLHQYSNGPVYGKYKDKIIKQVFDGYVEKSACFDFNYEIRKNGITITQASKNLISIIIPKFIENNKVNIIGKNAFYHNISLQKLIVEAELEDIGMYAFLGCYNLKTVLFQNPVKKVSRSAFNSCSNLEEIILPEGLISIETMAFRNCKCLKRVVLPATVCYIARDAFLESDSTIIYCQKGTYVEAFAKSNNISFNTNI